MFGPRAPIHTPVVFFYFSSFLLHFDEIGRDEVRFGRGSKAAFQAPYKFKAFSPLQCQFPFRFFGLGLESVNVKSTSHFSYQTFCIGFCALQFQLEDAVEREDFQEAAKLKNAISEVTSKDSVADIMSQMKNAIAEERYHDASQLSRCAGRGLVGWWAGCSKDSDDPFGKLIHITPGVGRYVGRIYSPRQLVTASPGTPVFEVFVVKNADGTYSSQVVFLQRVKGSSKSTSNSPSTKGPSTSEIEDESVVDVNRDEAKEEKSEGRNIKVEGETEEGLTSVLNFLKEKIPQLKFELSNTNVVEEVIEDDVKQFSHEGDPNAMHGEDSDSEISKVDDMGEGNQAKEDATNIAMKVFIGGVLHNEEDSSTKYEYVRQPAEILDLERDSFVLHIPARSQDHDSKENISAIEAKVVSELMPADVAKAFGGFGPSGEIPSKLSKDVHEIVKHAISLDQKRFRLSEYTSFRRIIPAEGHFDPFDGLYIGAFGPSGAEVVQLRRKYGSWNRKDDADKPSDIEFFEYVEAVKLTGDLNVPAGQVIFRAKIVKENRNPNRRLYPDELGAVASYKGQGMVAEYGFLNPKWVEGELLQLSGKGPYVEGADIGFLYLEPGKSFLVLFNRLKLPN
ncbi:hypothetical protein RHSIM_Rhsim08G0171200 [Rhododendron simsii]|uniref:Protein EXECUTER 2, chloroplastic n=1 Tax=Rhododendron simsii TaxID=118357 RepID=A0A834LIX0_RHOSS|nr:hypothetical protein RHSIM_Rhsim08G0171200 [Rhododendron simsii]